MEPAYLNTYGNAATYTNHRFRQNSYAVSGSAADTADRQSQSSGGAVAVWRKLSLTVGLGRPLIRIIVDYFRMAPTRGSTDTGKSLQ